MDTYVVRIYRKATDDRRILVGILEEPGTGLKIAFNSMSELERYLVGCGPSLETNDQES